MAETPIAEINGQPASADANAAIAWGNYGHFTSMQVRDGRTRGLDLHLERLDAANRELFDVPLPGDLIRERIRHAIGATRHATVRVRGYGTDVMVIVDEPVDLPDRPHALRSVGYQRPVPHLKHSGGFAQRYYRQIVAREGFDEGLLVDADGVISEGAFTNVGWWDGSAVVWPNAPALAGTTLQVLRRQLAVRGIAQRDLRVRLADLPSFATMFFCNSWGLAPVNRVDEMVLPVSESAMTMLREAYESEPWQEI
jgi:branched-subunit amino acid aminotransferase/4-amino-4-deoxychorismate lyase